MPWPSEGSLQTLQTLERVVVGEGVLVEERQEQAHVASLLAGDDALAYEPLPIGVELVGDASRFLRFPETFTVVYCLSKRTGTSFAIDF